MTAIAFVLASWQPDTPAGMERATANTAAALLSAGHEAHIITASPSAPSSYDGVRVHRLTSLDLAHPCDDVSLREAITANQPGLQRELSTLFDAHRIDAVVYVDALWGLGRIMPLDVPRHRVLAAHVLGHDTDLRPALAACTATIAPSIVVLRQAEARGFDTARWTILPNPIPDGEAIPASAREARRQHAPIRIMARLGIEKGIAALITAAPPALDRHTEIAVAAAGFETHTGSQNHLLDTCHHLAAGQPRIALRPGLPWQATSRWLGNAAAVIVPSRKESFGLVAAEAMASGTPVVAFDVDNLPALVADAGVIVPDKEGPRGLWRAAEQLLADPVAYAAASRAGYYLTRDYRPVHVANQLFKVVS